MTRARLLPLALLYGTVAAASCGTNAKGVEDCRAIEDARCSAARACGFIGDVDACQRFYRDQCLHGLAVTPPGASVISECADALRAAGTCFQSGREADCPAPFTPDSACDTVERPQLLAACSFLAPDDTGGEGGSTGTGGTGSGGSPDGSGGASGGASGGDSSSTGGAPDAG